MDEKPAVQSVERIASGPFSQVDVHWLREPALIAPDAQAYIDERWDHYQREAAKAGQLLFNGPVARLTNAQIDGSALQLFLQQSNYKTFVTTSLRDHAWFSANAPQAISGALGNSVLLWHGDRCLLGVRSAKVSTYSGMAHVFGGVLEVLGTPDRPANMDGLIAHLRQELFEELGLEPAHLAFDPSILYLGRDQILHQPELVWQWELASPIASIIDRLNPEEHSGYLIVARDADLEALRPALTPSAGLAVKLWRSSGG